MHEKRIVITGGSGFIGVHLVSFLIAQGYSVLNLDIRAPLDGKNSDLWRDCSIFDYELLKSIILNFSPMYIVHLAANTTQNATSLGEFQVNTQGTHNVAQVTNSLTQLKKFIFTSM